MTNYLDKLNLTPQERKIVIGVAIALFIVVNFVFVFPYFGELGRTGEKMRVENVKLANYKKEIDKRSAYEKQLRELEKSGEIVATEEQAVALTREVNNQALVSRVDVSSSSLLPGGAGGRTNIFFEEKAVQLNYQNTGEKELVDFLFNLGNANTLIRVKHMNIRPEPSKMKLSGQLTLVKSFQRRQPAKTPAPAPAPAPAAAKPASTSPPPAIPKPAETRKPEPVRKTNAPAPATGGITPTPAPGTPPRAVPTNIKPVPSKTNAALKPVK